MPILVPASLSTHIDSREPIMASIALKNMLDCLVLFELQSIEFIILPSINQHCIGSSYFVLLRAYSIVFSHFFAYPRERG